MDQIIASIAGANIIAEVEEIGTVDVLVARPTGDRLETIPNTRLQAIRIESPRVKSEGRTNAPHNAIGMVEVTIGGRTLRLLELTGKTIRLPFPRPLNLVEWMSAISVGWTRQVRSTPR